MAEIVDEPVEPIKQKTCVLKASIHCESCKRKVKKILSQVQGVECVDVDTMQQKVTVTGSVDADNLIKELVKFGKNAELWPQKAEEREEIPANGNKKEREIEAQKKMDHQEAKAASYYNVKAPETSTEVQVAAKKSVGSGGPLKAGDGGSARSNDETGGGAGGAAANSISVKTGGDIQETKTEEKKSEKNLLAAGEPPQAAEKKEAVEKSNGGGGGGGESGTCGKMKMKEEQSGDLPGSATPSAGIPAHRVTENQESGQPPPASHRPPRIHQKFISKYVFIKLIQKN